MKRYNKILLGFMVSTILVMVLVPPYYGQLLSGDTNIHSNLGYFPVWNPPTLEVCRIELLQIFEGTPRGDLLAEMDDPSSYRIGFNKVRFALNLVIVLLLYGALLLIGIWRARSVKTG